MAGFIIGFDGEKTGGRQRSLANSSSRNPESLPRMMGMLQALPTTGSGNRLEKEGRLVQDRIARQGRQLRRNLLKLRAEPGPIREIAPSTSRRLLAPSMTQRLRWTGVLNQLHLRWRAAAGQNSISSPPMPKPSFPAGRLARFLGIVVWPARDQARHRGRSGATCRHCPKKSSQPRAISSWLLPTTSTSWNTPQCGQPMEIEGQLKADSRSCRAATEQTVKELPTGLISCPELPV